MNSLGVCQYCAVILLNVALLSFLISAESKVDTNQEERNEVQDNTTNSSASESCEQAKLPANSTLSRALCHTYSARTRNGNEKDEKNIKPEVCRLILGDELLFATPAEQARREELFVSYTIPSKAKQSMPNSPKEHLTKFCWELILHMYCKFLLPKCDLTSSEPQRQRICREACREFKNQCQREWKQVQEKYNSTLWRVQQTVAGVAGSTSLMWCKGLPRRGSDIPECYYPKMLKDKTDPPPITDTCFHGDGQSFRGNVSVTQSGYTCQSWSSQCPHRHYRTPNNFPELRNVSNACRNPGGQAPHGPWCYTTNRKVRWEYCHVNKCGEGE